MAPSSVKASGVLNQVPYPPCVRPPFVFPQEPSAKFTTMPLSKGTATMARPRSKHPHASRSRALTSMSVAIVDSAPWAKLTEACSGGEVLEPIHWSVPMPDTMSDFSFGSSGAAGSLLRCRGILFTSIALLCSHCVTRIGSWAVTTSRPQKTRLFQTN